LSRLTDKESGLAFHSFWAAEGFFLDRGSSAGRRCFAQPFSLDEK
jgi:hypothetical protein